MDPSLRVLGGTRSTPDAVCDGNQPHLRDVLAGERLGASDFDVTGGKYPGVMNNGRERCAGHAIGEQGDYWGLTPADLLATESGHHFHHGWHIGWAWSAGGDAVYIDLLSEHRMTSMDARRVFPDGSVEPLDTPHEMRRVGDTREEDERLEREYIEHNRYAYASLRDRGLLPEFGENVGSQDLNEYLRSGNEDRH